MTLWKGLDFANSQAQNAAALDVHWFIPSIAGGLELVDVEHEATSVQKKFNRFWHSLEEPWSRICVRRPGKPTCV